MAQREGLPMGHGAAGAPPRAAPTAVKKPAAPIAKVAARPQTSTISFYLLVCSSISINLHIVFTFIILLLYYYTNVYFILASIMNHCCIIIDKILFFLKYLRFIQVYVVHRPFGTNTFHIFVCTVFIFLFLLCSILFWFSFHFSQFILFALILYIYVNMYNM